MGKEGGLPGAPPLPGAMSHVFAVNGRTTREGNEATEGAKASRAACRGGGLRARPPARPSALLASFLPSLPACLSLRRCHKNTIIDGVRA